MKNIVLAGNIGKSAELRSTQDGDKVAGFSLAVTEGYGDKQRTLWFNCSIWGKRAETLAPMLTKGGKVTVSGDLSTREHDGKTYLTVRANDVTLQSARQGGDDDRPQGKQASGGYGAGGRPGRNDMDDAIPFAPESR
jgi:single-strand DNA-binding protein